MREAGCRIENEQAQIEISPSYALDVEELAARLPRPLTITNDLLLTVS